MANEIHVVPNGDQWEVTSEGDADPIATYDTQAEAIDFGRDQARNDKVEFLVHGADGAIREKTRTATILATSLAGWWRHAAGGRLCAEFVGVDQTLGNRVIQ